ncbi:MAG TPA: HAMP domain-containing protein, partial [Polyangiaceae bacterium]|nr:HAMP domain-containing protein [Polyangiaceae bacterium]
MTSAPEQLAATPAQPGPAPAASKRSVSRRILAAFLLVLALFSGASAWSVLSFRQAVEEAELLRQGYLPLALRLRDLVANQDSYNSQLNHVTTARNPSDARAWFEAALSVGRPRKIAQVENALNRAFVIEQNELGRRELSADLKKVKELMSLDAPLMSSLFSQLAQGRQEAAQLTRDRLVQQGLRVQRSLVRLESRVTGHMDRLLVVAKNRERTAFSSLIFLSCLAVLVGLLTVVYVRRVLLPLSAVTARARRVAAGDLTVHAPLSTGDEIGQLSQTFEEMVQAIFAARERLVAAERLAAIGKMAAHVTHEVRNPLSSIALNLELLEDELKDDQKEARALLRSIGQEVQRLSGLSDQYLSMARRKPPDFEATDLKTLILSAADFMRRDLARHSVQLDVEVAEELPLLQLDQGQFRQALFNLVRNAREAMVEG